MNREGERLRWRVGGETSRMESVVRGEERFLRDRASVNRDR